MTTLRLQLKETIKWYVSTIKRCKKEKEFYPDEISPYFLHSIGSATHATYHIGNLIRPYHFAASLLRGKKFEQIENYKKWKKGKLNKPNFEVIRKVINHYAKEHTLYKDGTLVRVPKHKYLNEILDHLKEVEKCIDSM